MDRTYRVVVAEAGTGATGREAPGLARALRDAGFEVIHVGLVPTAEQVVESVLQEDADALGLVVRSDPGPPWFPRVRELLAARGLDDVVVFGDEIVPDDELAAVAARLEGALDAREG